MRRWLVLFLSAAAGVAAGVGYAICFWPVRPVANGPFVDPAWDSQRVALEICGVFYFVTFGVGRVLGRWILSAVEVEEIRRSGRSMQWRLAVCTVVVVFGSRLSSWLG